MVYYMTGEVVAPRPERDLTPKVIVAELDRYIVGQEKAKRAVAIALRNRMRRMKLDPEMAEEVAPKNIIMMGRTGVGKTEIARRLARLTGSPFIKVEASKYTEVGYVGRDVERRADAVVIIKPERVRPAGDGFCVVNVFLDRFLAVGRGPFEAEVPFADTCGAVAVRFEE